MKREPRCTKPGYRSQLSACLCLDTGRMPSRRSAYAVLSMTWVVVVASQAVTDVSNESELRAALQAARPQGSDVLHRIRLSTTIFLNSTLDINATHGRLELTGGGLYLSRCDHGVPVLRFQGAVGVTLQGVTVTLPCARNPTFAIEAIGSADVKISRSRIVGGIRIADSLRPIVERCDVSNPWGAGGGSCVNIATCGNATTLVGCGAAVRQTEIHDCRANGGSPYAPGAQGVLLGGPEGSAQCTVGVIVEHNFVHSIDEMGIRGGLCGGLESHCPCTLVTPCRLRCPLPRGAVSNNNYYPCVNNQVVFNRVQDWGQLPASGGGDNTDSGALCACGQRRGRGRGVGSPPPPPLSAPARHVRSLVQPRKQLLLQLCTLHQRVVGPERTLL